MADKLIAQVASKKLYMNGLLCYCRALQKLQRVLLLVVQLIQRAAQLGYILNDLPSQGKAKE
jgi:hypothetical protein